MRRICRRSPLLSAILLVSSSLLFGCNAPGRLEATGAPQLGYFSARAYDLMDILELDLGAGTGLHANAAVEPIRVAYGYYHTKRIGMMGRSVGIWDENRKEFYMGINTVLHWEKVPQYGNAYLFTEAKIHRHSWRLPEEIPGRLDFYDAWGWTVRTHDWERPWMDVNAEATLLFVSVDVGVSPQEIFDFLLGIVGVDAISGDDYEATPDEEIIVEGEPAIEERK